jgi:glyoxylase-like metal-dependent hydrolase (beta-lactamase superfamily II)
VIELGRLRIHTLNDGFFAMDGGAMFGVVPKPLWSRDVPADEQNRIAMSLHCPLAVDGKEVTLIDTGLGERLSEKESAICKVDRRGGLVARLAELGIDPEDVTAVVLTHLHFDHVGGVFRRDDAGHLHPTFPRARHFIQRRELLAALHPADERSAAAYHHAHECLEPLHEAGLIEQLDGDTELSPRLRVVVTGGHTATHQCAVFSDGGSSLLHLGDIAPTRAHLRPAWNQAYDVDPLTTTTIKKELLERAAAEGWWVSFDHDHRVACAKLAPGWQKSGTVTETHPLVP